ncbi:hypothetical protein N566_09615 [Streptomycetaceae bacterium MP113-05]|nr:hypothetical protein N566_09615 [Streptomycetaceae bacterium MP113-05]
MGVFIGSLILGPIALVLGVVDLIIAIVAISVLSSSGFTY